MNKQYREALKPFSQHVMDMYGKVVSLTDAELEVLRDACESVSTTNCSWDEYRAAKSIKPEVDGEIYRRSSYLESNS
jgi:hypothetical protein